MPATAWSHIFIPTTTIITFGESEKALAAARKIREGKLALAQPNPTEFCMTWKIILKETTQKPWARHSSIERTDNKEMLQIIAAMGNFLQTQTSDSERRDRKTWLWLLSVAEGSGTSRSQSL